jgi:hypothetical protein
VFHAERFRRNCRCSLGKQVIPIIPSFILCKALELVLHTKTPTYGDQKMLYLAIDQHKAQLLTLNLRNEKGDVIQRGQISTNQTYCAGNKN